MKTSKTRFPFALYDAFSTGAFGGATAGIVSDAAGLSPKTMQRTAIEIGAPATAFVRGMESNLIDVRFFSTITELGMCGHGTVALSAHLLDSGALSWDEQGEICTVLRTPDGDSPLTLRKHNGRALAMLELHPSTFEVPEINREVLAEILGISQHELGCDLPIETAIGAFIHLVVPVRSLKIMQQITPNFGAIADFSRANGVQTVSVFTREVAHPDSTVHVRDFCPAVGTPESPAAGTTNGALTCYLVRNGLLEIRDGDTSVVLAEQGYECGRPSQIRSEMTVVDGRIERLVVGGFGRKSVSGEIFLP